MNTNKIQSKYLKGLTFLLLLMLVGGGLFFVLKAGWQGRCSVVWVKLIWQWARPDQRIGSGLTIHYYNLSDQCTARAIIADKIYISLEENGYTWAQPTIPKQLMYFLVNWGKWLFLLVVTAIVALMWWFLKSKQRTTNETSEHS
ncbi:MAG TPA: hypothetical protein PKH77_15380 [Anaerolineae bacterium]|nr:hypothetical protein [Anaerolineae bacterium]